MSSLALFSFAALHTLLGVESAWAAGENQQVAIVDVFEAPEDLKRDLRSAMGRSLGLLEADLIPHAFLSQQLLACDDNKCRIEVARLAGADYVFLVSGKHDTQAFELRTQVWSGATGQQLGDASRSCALCTLKELFAASEDQTSTLLARARVAVDAGPSSEASNPKQQEARWAGWATAAAGVAVAAVTGILWARDHRCEKRTEAGECRLEKRQPGGDALPWLTVGGVLTAGVGVLMISGTF